MAVVSSRYTGLLILNRMISVNQSACSYTASSNSCGSRKLGSEISSLGWRATIVSCTEFVINLLEKRFVQEELLLVHLSLSYLNLLLFHLSLEEILIVPVDLVYFVVQTAFFLRVVSEILIPHVSLLVVEGFLLKLTASLIFHLLSKVIAHPLLF